MTTGLIVSLARAGSIKRMKRRRRVWWFWVWLRSDRDWWGR